MPSRKYFGPFCDKPDGVSAISLAFLNESAIRLVPSIPNSHALCAPQVPRKRVERRTTAQNRIVALCCPTVLGRSKNDLHGPHLHDVIHPDLLHRETPPLLRTFAQSGSE